MRGRSAGVGFELGQQLGSDGQQIAAGQFLDLAGVAEARAHDLRLVAELLVVVVDRRDRLHAGIVGALVVLAGVLLVPVEDAADEGRDQRDLGFGAGDGLVQTEEQRHVAVDAFLLQFLGGLDAFPGGGELDQDALAADACALVGAMISRAVAIDFSVS